MGWEVTAAEVSAGVATLEEQLSGALRFARGDLDSVSEDSRAEVEANIGELLGLAESLEGIGGHAAEIRWFAEEAEAKFAEMDEMECPECGERFPDAEAEGWRKEEGRCLECSEADHNDHADYDPEEY